MAEHHLLLLLAAVLAPRAVQCHPPAQSVGDASAQYLEAYRRYNYTTPKSYLELISLYKSLLGRKRAKLTAAKERLQNGVEKIAQASAQVRAARRRRLWCCMTAARALRLAAMHARMPVLARTRCAWPCPPHMREQVADLQAVLREEQVVVAEKQAQTDALIVSIGKEKAVVDEAVEAGREDEEAASKLQNEVQAFQEECSADLAVGARGLGGWAARVCAHAYMRARMHA